MKQYDFIKDPDKTGDDSIVISDSPKFKFAFWPFLSCILLAVIIWLYVVNLNYSATVKKNMLVGVDVVGDESIAENEEFGISYNVSEMLVAVQGASRDFEKYSESDYKLILDVGNIKEVGEYNIPLRASFPSGISISGDYPIVKVYAYEVMTTTVKLRYNLGSNDKYKYECDPSSTTEITIIGPKEIIEKIDYAMFTLSGVLETDRVYSDGVSLDYIAKDASTLSTEEAVRVSYAKTENLYIKINVTVIEPETVTEPATSMENSAEETVDSEYASAEIGTKDTAVTEESTGEDAQHTDVASEE